MKYFGRITIYGEYLVHTDISKCLVVQSKMFLENSKSSALNYSNRYITSKDSILEYLKDNNLDYSENISGNLIMGYGLASSTVLCFLHLGNSTSKELVNRIDKMINHFTPSQLDYTSILNQENGLYGKNFWNKISLSNFYYSLIKIPKERKMRLSKIKRRMQFSENTLADIAEILNKDILNGNDLNYETYLDYCKELLHCEVYSAISKEIISYLISLNIASKTIGGLYDKAILVVYETELNKNKIEFDLMERWSEIELLE